MPNDDMSDIPYQYIVTQRQMSFVSLREQITNWTLEQDDQFFNAVQALSESIFQSEKQINANISQTKYELKEEQVHLGFGFNRFLKLSEHKFTQNKIEERVEADKQQKKKQEAKPISKSRMDVYKEAIMTGIKNLQLKEDEGQKDMMSMASVSEYSYAMNQAVFKNTRLPPLFGSRQFASQPFLSLFTEEDQNQLHRNSVANLMPTSPDSGNFRGQASVLESPTRQEPQRESHVGTKQEEVVVQRQSGSVVVARGQQSGPIQLPQDAVSAPVQVAPQSYQEPYTPQEVQRGSVRQEEVAQQEPNKVLSFQEELNLKLLKGQNYQPAKQSEREEQNAPEVHQAPMIPTIQPQQVPQQVPRQMPVIPVRPQAEPIRKSTQPGNRNSVSGNQNFNDIMTEGQQFGAGSSTGEKKLFQEEEEDEQNAIFGKSKTRKKEEAKVVEDRSAEAERRREEEERRKREEAEMLMKRSTFNDSALFKKKNLTQSMAGKRPEPKKNIFQEQSEEESSPLVKPIRKAEIKKTPETTKNVIAVEEVKTKVVEAKLVVAEKPKKEDSFPLARPTKKAEPKKDEQKTTPVQPAKKATPVKQKKNLFDDEEEEDSLFSKPAKKKEEKSPQVAKKAEPKKDLFQEEKDCKAVPKQKKKPQQKNLFEEQDDSDIFSKPTKKAQPKKTVVKEEPKPKTQVKPNLDPSKVQEQPNKQVSASLSKPVQKSSPKKNLFEEEEEEDIFSKKTKKADSPVAAKEEKKKEPIPAKKEEEIQQKPAPKPKPRAEQPVKQINIFSSDIGTSQQGITQSQAVEPAKQPAYKPSFSQSIGFRLPGMGQITRSRMASEVEPAVQKQIEEPQSRVEIKHRSLFVSTQTVMVVADDQNAPSFEDYQHELQNQKRKAEGFKEELVIEKKKDQIVEREEPKPVIVEEVKKQTESIVPPSGSKQKNIVVEEEASIPAPEQQQQTEPVRQTPVQPSKPAFKPSFSHQIGVRLPGFAIPEKKVEPQPVAVEQKEEPISVVTTQNKEEPRKEVQQSKLNETALVEEKAQQKTVEVKMPAQKVTNPEGKMLPSIPTGEEQPALAVSVPVQRQAESHKAKAVDVKSIPLPKVKETKPPALPVIDPPKAQKKQSNKSKGLLFNEDQEEQIRVKPRVEKNPSKKNNFMDAVEDISFKPKARVEKKKPTKTKGLFDEQEEADLTFKKKQSVPEVVQRAEAKNLVFEEGDSPVQPKSQPSPVHQEVPKKQQAGPIKMPQQQKKKGLLDDEEEAEPVVVKKKEAKLVPSLPPAKKAEPVSSGKKKGILFEEQEEIQLTRPKKSDLKAAPVEAKKKGLLFQDEQEPELIRPKKKSEVPAIPKRPEPVAQPKKKGGLFDDDEQEYIRKAPVKAVKQPVSQPPPKKQGLYDDDEPVKEKPVAPKKKKGLFEEEDLPVPTKQPRPSQIKKTNNLFGDEDEADDFPMKKPTKQASAKPKNNLFGDDDDDFPVMSTKSKPSAKNKKKLFDDSD